MGDMGYKAKLKEEHRKEVMIMIDKPYKFKKL